jgi:hypothetical protein
VSSVSEWVVREYFEQRGYLVHQPRKYVGTAGQKTAAGEVDLVVCNPNVAEHSVPAHMVWTSTDLAHVARAVVAVSGGHTDRAYPAMFEQAPELLRFVEPASLRQAARLLGSTDIARILCVTRLPVSGESKEKTIALLKDRGIHGIIEFETILGELIDGVEKNRNYEKSDLLQILRLLKVYNFIKDPQMELFSRKARNPHIRGGVSGAREAEGGA